MKNNQQNIEQLLELYKGISPKLFQGLNETAKKNLINKTIKELCLLAESANQGAGEKLYQILSSLNTQKKLPLLEIEALIEYGRTYDLLNKKEAKLVADMEIQQELSHFSRIMNLDGILTGLTKDNLETAIDYSRFLELLTERREDRNVNSLSSWGRPSKALTFTATNSPVCGIMQEEAEKNYVALLAANTNTQTFSPKETLLEYGKLAHRFNIRTASLLFDYLLSLKQIDPEIAFVSAHSRVTAKTTLLEISGGGGCGLLILESEKDNPFKKRVIRRLTVGKNYSWDFGKVAQSLVEYIDLKFKDTSLKVLCFHPEAWRQIEKLSNKELYEVLNKKHSNGWFNQTNAITEYLKNQHVNSQVAILTPSSFANGKKIKSTKKPSLVNAINSLNDNSSLQRLVSKKNVVIESAHLHADRQPGKEQWDCILVTNKLHELLAKNGFIGRVDKLVMVDDYHVINRLNYKTFGQALREKGLNFSNIVLESSPLIRMLAIDILRYLAVNHRDTTHYQITERGDNLYLEIPNKGLSIELVANTESNPMIGCVLFDVAFTLYKSNIEFYNHKYGPLFGLRKNEDLHSMLIDFFNSNKNTEDRIKKVSEYYVDIPSWEQLQKVKEAPEFIYKSSIVNVLEDFYKPQQNKVNNFLKVLGQEQIYSLYYNLESNEISLEITGGDYNE